MQSDRGTKGIRIDLFVGLCNLVTAFLMFPLRRPGGWPIAVVVAVVSGMLLFLADRSRRGLWLLIGCGMALIWALPVATGIDVLPGGIVPWLVLGVGSAVLLNRIIFGLVRPVPAFRRERRGLR